METQPPEPAWFDVDDALTAHDRQLAEHGGGSGIRDRGALDSVLTRPVNKWAYGEHDLAALAASYAFGIARNHPFVDGNKRTAWVLARSFLILNGQDLTYEREEAVNMMRAVAAGASSEAACAKWISEHLRGG